MKYLDRINSTNDLKKFSLPELNLLAKEIRETIISTVSKNGGHLASSLGVVELTIAIHYVFNAPFDKIIWDVGHQTYAHKLLTGRKNQFNTLRKYKGLSGFTKISESRFDAFTTGHSSTSISAGLGMVCAKELNQDNSKVVAVIGDGSLTAGIAFEGLNQAGDLRKNFIVILNDNDMSISPNVGALSSLLSRSFSSKYLINMKKEFGNFLKSLPKIGNDMYKLAKRSKNSFKTFITPGMLFEALDFEYFGPINGHKLNHLIDILENIKSLEKPVLIHVTTKKGKGYAPAEKNPVYFHGVGVFDIDTGNSSSTSLNIPSYTDVFGQTLTALAQKDDKIVAVTAAMPEGTGLTGFSREFPKRFFDVGIAEQHGITFAAGLATEGFKPVVAIYSTFLQRAYDQILHDVCIESLPVKFAIDRGGVVGEDGPTHHGLFDFSYLRALPNMVIMAPKDENELSQMLKTAIDYDKGPIAVRYPRGKGMGVKLSDTSLPIEIGKAEILTDGGDVLILAIGSSVAESIKACEKLSESNIFATVVNCRFVKPLDEKLILDLSEKIKNIITVEDHMKSCGFGSAVLECLNDNYISGVRVTRLGIDDVFVEHGPQKLLREIHKIDSAAIICATKQMVKNYAGQ